jgi:branched-chain amino acid transport system ATP-binding protein
VSPVIEAAGLSAGYNGMEAIHQIDLAVEAGELVLLAGPNGAGKSTTVMTLAGAITPMAGEVRLHGAATREMLHRRVRSGVGVVTEKRSVFSQLTTAENLRLGRGSPEAALDLFPELRKRLNVRAGLLSGGEQQMLSLARVLAAKPKVVLADELSLGLAPIIVRRLLNALRRAAAEGAAVLLVEQHVALAMEMVDRAYFIRRGRVQLTGRAADLKADQKSIESLYL